MDTPNEKTSGPLIAIGALVLLTFGASLLPASWFGIQPTKKEYRKVDLSELSLSDVVKDSDSDSNISWKELVTDTLTPSEIAEIQQDGKPDPKVIADLNDPNNLTASFSKNLYSVSAYLSKNQLNDPEAEQGILNQLIEAEAVKIQPTTYTLKDINVAKSESKESIKAYGNALSSILGDMITEKRIVDDFESIAKFTNTNDETDLLPLKQDFQRVDVKFAKILALPVPLSAATYHILALTRVAAYRDALYNLSKAADDPVRAMLFIEKYPETTVAALRAFSIVSPYFDVQNVVFSTDEPGYAFTVGYTLK